MGPIENRVWWFAVCFGLIGAGVIIGLVLGRNV